MNIFELLWILVFVGGGIVIGNHISSQHYAGIVGGAIGFVVLIAFGKLMYRNELLAPRCKCGAKDWKHFNSRQDETWGLIHIATCGQHYIRRKGNLWYEIEDSANPVLKQIRSFFGDWRDPTQTEIANNGLHSDAIKEPRR